MALVLDETRGQRRDLAHTNERLDAVVTALEVHKAQHDTHAHDEAESASQRSSWQQHRQGIYTRLSASVVAIGIFLAGHLWR